MVVEDEGFGCCWALDWHTSAMFGGHLGQYIWVADCGSSSLFKKWIQSLCPSYRWITFISLHGNVYIMVLNVHLLVESRVQEEQCSLCHGHGIHSPINRVPHGSLLWPRNLIYLVHHYVPIVIWSLHNCSKRWSILLVLNQICSEWVLYFAKAAFFTDFCFCFYRANF